MTSLIMQTSAVFHTMEAAPIGGSATQSQLLVESASQGLKRIQMMTNATVISCIYTFSYRDLC